MTPEQAEVAGTFAEMLRAATQDGGRKRAKGQKPSWKVDPDHEKGLFSHLSKWKKGDLVDPDSGAHPLVHLAWRALAIAWQETHPDAKKVPEDNVEPAEAPPAHVLPVCHNSECVGPSHKCPTCPTVCGCKDATECKLADRVEHRWDCSERWGLKPASCTCFCSQEAKKAAGGCYCHTEPHLCGGAVCPVPGCGARNSAPGDGLSPHWGAEPQ